MGAFAALGTGGPPAAAGRGQGGGRGRGRGTAAATNFANALSSIHNMLDDYSAAEISDPKDILLNDERKRGILAALRKRDYEKFNILVGTFDGQDEETIQELCD